MILNKESDVTRTVFLGTLLLIVAGWVSPLTADDASPSVTAMQTGANNLYEDLNYVFSLCNEEDKKQWPILQEYIDVFLKGIDRARPIRVDLVMGGERTRYIW